MARGGSFVGTRLLHLNSEGFGCLATGPVNGHVEMVGAAILEGEADAHGISVSVDAVLSGATDDLAHVNPIALNDEGRIFSGGMRG